jgi:glycerophosphoryl diester phosphodiesterase
MHDLTVDRTTNGKGAVAHLRLEELRRLDAGDGPPPTLSEALSLAGGKTILVAEIKQPGVEERVAGVVRDVGALDAVMVWSFFPQALESMRRAEPRLPAALLIGPQTVPQWPEMWRLAVRLGLQGVSVFCYSLTEEMVQDARRHGLSVYTWTADPEEEIQRLLDLGVDGICTNYPDRAIALAAARSKG